MAAATVQSGNDVNDAVHGSYAEAYVEAPSSPECSPWQYFGAC
jgi:hypothetical protein